MITDQLRGEGHDLPLAKGRVIEGGWARGAWPLILSPLPRSDPPWPGGQSDTLGCNTSRSARSPNVMKDLSHCLLTGSIADCLKLLLAVLLVIQQYCLISGSTIDCLEELLAELQHVWFYLAVVMSLW